MTVSRSRHRPRLAVLRSLLSQMAWVALVAGCGLNIPDEATVGVGEGLQVGHGEHASTTKSSKVRICHFEGEKHSAKVISVSEQALSAHLAHGDGLAPPSVVSDADCLVAQPPASPVSVEVISDAAGLARSTIPDTNVVASVSVLDVSGVGVSGVHVTILVQGQHYIAIATDPESRYRSAMALGVLSEARPGSALTLAIVLVLEACGLVDDINGIFQLISSAGNNSLLTSQFVNGSLVIDECFTKTEFEQRVAGLCDIGAISSGLVVGSGTGGVPGALAGCVGGLVVCPAIARFFGSSFFPDGASPQRVRLTWGGPIPWIEPVGSCGGACCGLANSGTCSDVSRATNCLSFQGEYLDGEFCSDDPCISPDADLDTSVVPTPDPVEVGQPATFQFRVANHGPAVARDVVATITAPPGLTPNGAVFAVSSMGTSRPCSASSGGQITCNIGALPVYDAGAAVPVLATIEGSATTTEPGQFSVTMVATTTNNDPTAANNVATAEWNVECPEGAIWDPTTLHCESAPCPWETPRRNPDTQGCESCPDALPVWNRITRACTAPSLTFSCSKQSDYVAITLTGDVSPAECRDEEFYPTRFCRPIEYEGGYFDEDLCYAGVSYTIHGERGTRVEEMTVAGYNDVGGPWGHWYGVFGLDFWDTILLYYWDPWTPVYGSDPVRRVQASVTIDGCYSLTTDWIDCAP